jgi:anti-sigma regulatory factor (Ser/Thr protein kinase)
MTRELTSRFAADLQVLSAVRDFIEDSGHELGVNEESLADLCLVVDEAVTNAILHGYQGQPGFVDIEMQRSGDSVIIRILDRARPFDASDVESPHLDAPLAQREFGGMGVFLIRKLTDELEFLARENGGNELRLVKHNAFQ